MSLYEFLLFLHVACAAVWLGGALWTQVHGFVVVRSGDPVRGAQYAGEVGRLGERVFIPAALGVVLAGVGLMLEGSWDWGQLWVLFGLAGFALSFLLGLLVLAPTAKAIEKAIEAEGLASPTAQALIRKVFRLGRGELVVLYMVVFAMTVKPTTDDGWTVAIGAAVLVGLVAFFLVRGREPAPAAETA